MTGLSGVVKQKAAMSTTGIMINCGMYVYRSWELPPTSLDRSRAAGRSVEL